MRRQGARFGMTMLLLGCAAWWTGQGRADPPDNPAPPAGSTSLFSHWIGSSFKDHSSPATAFDTDQPAKKDTKPATEAKEKPKDKAEKPTVDPISVRQKVRADYLRRLNVCDQLQSIADKTGDQALANKAQQLAERAGRIYEARMAELPVPQTVVQAKSDKK